MTIKQTKKEEQLRKVLRHEIAKAEGGDDSDIATNRTNALKAYYGGEAPDLGNENPDDQLTLMSSNDVADMTTAVLAQLTPMLSTDALVNFEPKGQDDEEQARAESGAVNNIIIEQNQGFIEIQEAVKDALLLRNCAAKVYIDDQQHTRSIPLSLPVGEDGEEQPLSNAEIAALLQPRQPNETRELTRNAVKVTITRRRFRMAAVPIDNIIYEANADTSDIQSFRFFAERLFYTRSELVEMGFSKATVDDLPHYTDDTQRTTQQRNRTNREPHYAETKDQQIIECYEAYQLIDLDGDGISERYTVLLAGSYVMEYEQVPLIPYSVGTAFLNSHRLLGESLYDRLKDTQKVKTYFLRQWMTNAAYVAQGRWAADPKQVNFDDLLSFGRNAIRTKQGAEVHELRTADVGASMLAALEYQDKIRSERGGAALDMMSAELQIAGDTAHGVERQYSQKELLVAFMATNLGETFIRPLYLIMHEYLRRYANEPLAIKLNGQWVQVDPTQWQPRERCNVKAGKSAGERTHIQRVLSQVIQLQIAAMQQGLDGVLVDLQNIFNAVSDWATYAGLDTPDGYLVNPSSPQSQKAQQGKAQQAQQKQRAMQTAQQAQQQLIQEQLNLERQKLMIDAKKNNDEIAYKYWSDRLKAETDEAKTVATGTIELEKIQIQGEQRESDALNGAQNGAARNGGAAR